MSRLSPRAFEILREEIQKRSGSDPIGQTKSEIALKRLEKLRSQSGEPADLDELRDVILDLYPDFDGKVLRAAAKANGSGGANWSLLKLTGMSLVGLAALIYIVNLPFPMIRWPVAKTMPLLLLPSYMSMDHHYRQATSLVEQADQLINQSTSADDIELGETKAQQAQKSLDQLPVWFLGYFPQRYCTFFSCSWQFTFDEFETARKQIGRIEAKVFQEKNAQTALTEGEQALNTAKAEYQQAQAQTEKTQAIAAWQSALDSLTQIPAQTLAGRQAQTKLEAYQRDFQQVAGLTAGSNRSGTLISAAQEFARNAAQSAQNPPHTATEWQETLNLWDQAIARLQQIPLEDPGYLEAQKLLATYQTNLGQVRIRLANEQAAVPLLDEAKSKTEALIANTTAASDRNQLKAQIQGILNQLDKIPPGTSPYDEAQALKQSAEKKLKQLQ